MQLGIPFIALLASATAAPTALDRRQGQNDLCGGSTFVGETTPDSADVRDCERILFFLSQTLSAQGSFEVTDRTRSLLDYQTCSFSARTTRGGFSFVGSQDAFDLIRDAVREKQSGGRIGASGLMHCNGVEVEWRIARSNF